MFRFIYNTIARLAGKIRLWLNTIRSNKPEKFDKTVKITTFLVPIASCFAPAIFTHNWLRASIEFVVLVLILVFQWSTLTNRIAEKDNNNKYLRNELKDCKKEIEELKKEIEQLNRDSNDYTDWIGEDEAKNRQSILLLNQHCDDIAGFSHSVSDNVKKIIAEIEKPIDPRVVSRITTFLQQSLTSLEELLSNYYSKDIRASIKITIEDGIVKTYARGKNNIESRGGIYPCAGLNSNKIKIEDNYAYIAIVRRGQRFFAEADLSNMKNKFKPEDEFFCEYDDYGIYFCSTIVMPIRIPVFLGIPPEQPEPMQEILGLICIDCSDEITEWSDPNLTEKRAYHIIADYADSLAMLMKEFRDASK